MRDNLVRLKDRISLQISRRKLLRNIKESQKSSDFFLEVLADSMSSLNPDDKIKYSEFNNTFMYISLVNRDLSYIVKYLFTSDSESEKNFFARHAIMTIYELLIDINSLVGDKLRRELITNGFSNLEVEAKSINKEYSQIKKAHQKKLSEVRNNYSAHKTKKAIEYLKATRNLDVFWVKKLCFSIVKLNNRTLDLGFRITKDHIEKI